MGFLMLTFVAPGVQLGSSLNLRRVDANVRFGRTVVSLLSWHTSVGLSRNWWVRLALKLTAKKEPPGPSDWLASWDTLALIESTEAALPRLERATRAASALIRMN